MQGNTFLVNSGGDGGDGEEEEGTADVERKVYDETNEGIIQSWVERSV